MTTIVIQPHLVQVLDQILLHIITIISSRIKRRSLSEDDDDDHHNAFDWLTIMVKFFIKILIITIIITIIIITIISSRIKRVSPSRADRQVDVAQDGVQTACQRDNSIVGKVRISCAILSYVCIVWILCLYLLFVLLFVFLNFKLMS